MRSHTKKEILNALKQGLSVYKLDTNTAGEDDILIGEYNDCLIDVLNYFEIDRLPVRWTLEQIYNID